MREPEDYGLSAEQTLCQVAPSTPPAGFVQHWSVWRERVWAASPALRPVRGSELGACGAAGVSHILDSVRNVRLGCRICPPRSGDTRAVVLTTHGYLVPSSEPMPEGDARTDRGVTVIHVRVRGYPGSQLDTGDLTARPEGFAAIGLEVPGASILLDAVADLVNALRAARAAFAPHIPLYLHGESFGAGLAILAASLLPRALAPQRLVIGVPTFGWWSWRLARRAHFGAGRDIAGAIERHPDRAAAMIESLAMLDAVVHARRVTGAALCKVAERDDVVPAPTAAAVYNALGSDPGRKWRFVTRYGHFDGGLADLRRHALFDRLAGEFLDPTADLESLMRTWAPVLRFGERPPPTRADIRSWAHGRGEVSVAGQ